MTKTILTISADKPAPKLSMELDALLAMTVLGYDSKYLPSNHSGFNNSTPILPRYTALVAIDPGDVHCGVAVFNVAEYQNPIMRPLHGFPQAFFTCELAPHEMVYYASSAFRMLAHVVVEDFNLDPAQAMAQAGSDMATCQLIGALKYIAAMSTQPTLLHKPPFPVNQNLTDPNYTEDLDTKTSEQVHGAFASIWPKRTFDSFFTMQSRTIKVPTKKRLGAPLSPDLPTDTPKPISHARTYGTGGHALDAELHGIYYLLHNKVEIYTKA